MSNEEILVELMDMIAALSMRIDDVSPYPEAGGHSTARVLNRLNQLREVLKARS